MPTHPIHILINSEIDADLIDDFCSMQGYATGDKAEFIEDECVNFIVGAVISWREQVAQAGISVVDPSGAISRG